MRSPLSPNHVWMRSLVAVVLVAAAAGSAHAVAPFTLETVDGGPGAVVGEYTSMKLDRQGHPHIAYYDAVGGNLRYAHHDGSQWWIEVADGAAADVGQFASLALDTLGTPHIAYYDETIGKLRYTTKVGGLWIREVADSSSFDCGWYPSIALDANQHPWIASYDRGRGNPRVVRRIGTNRWQRSTVDTTFDLSGFYTTLAVDSAFRPHVAYYNLTRGMLQYATVVNGAWHIETADSTNGDIGLYSSLAMDAKGRVHVAHMDLTNGDVRYVRRDPASGTWSREVAVGGPNIAGYDCSMTLDPAGLPNLSYHDGTTLHFAMARKTPTGSWQVLTVDDSPGVTGLYSSIASDRLGNLCMSYWDGSAYKLRFARMASPLLDVTPVTPGARGLAVSPNPAPAGARIRLAGPSTLRAFEVFDVMGRQLAHLPTDGTGRAEWDARTSAGMEVEAGVYFARGVDRDGRRGEATLVTIVH